MLGRCAPLVVEVRGRLVEDEHGRPNVQRPRTTALALVAGGPSDAVPDDDLLAPSRPPDDDVDVRRLKNVLHHLCLDVRSTTPAQGIGGPHVVDDLNDVRHVADRALPGLSARLERHAVDRHTTGARLEQAEDDVRRVLLPEPVGPMTPSPRSTEKPTFRSAGCV